MPSVWQMLRTELVWSAVNVRSCRSFSGPNFLGRPPCRPRARAAAKPVIVRSLMRSRSNSASAPKTWKTSLPPLVLVS